MNKSKTSNKRIMTVIITIIIILIGSGANYILRRIECKDINQNYRCGGYDCSIKGYISNHGLCQK